MQKDLFGTASVAAMPDSMSTKISFLDRYRMSVRLDQALFLMIGLLVIYVLVFSFGVETGKRYAMAELKAERLKHERMVDELRDKVFAAPAAIENSVVSIAVVSKVSQANADAPAVQANSKSSAESDLLSGKFTIQTMTIASKTVAEKEIQRLAQKGMKGYIIPKGKMHEICINAFESREKAYRSLKELKTQRLVPPDAYVRPVAS